MQHSKNKKIKVAAIGDLHAHEHGRGSFRSLFEQVTTQADVVLLCGDLTNFGLPAEARALAEDISVLKVPVLAVLGNHDCESGQEKEVKEIFTEAGVKFLDEDSFEYSGVSFVGVKGFGGGFESYMLGSFGEKAIKDFVGEAIKENLRLEKLLQDIDTNRIVVVLHYAPIAATVAGEPKEIYPFLGSSRLAETIDRFPVSVVFHGHAHHGHIEGKTAKGIPVYNCAFKVLQHQNPPKQFLIVDV